jgi:hypothetical protein
MGLSLGCVVCGKERIEFGLIEASSGEGQISRVACTAPLGRPDSRNLDLLDRELGAYTARLGSAFITEVALRAAIVQLVTRWISAARRQGMSKQHNRATCDTDPAINGQSAIWQAGPKKQPRQPDPAHCGPHRCTARMGSGRYRP